MTSRNFTALIRPVTPEEVAEFKRSNAAGTASAQKVVAVVGGVVAASIGAYIMVMIIVTIAWTGISPLQLLMIAGVIAVFAAGTVAIVKGLRGAWMRRLRKTQFARDNGFIYGEAAGAPGYPGLIFDEGTGRQRTETFFTVTGRSVEVANYRYTTGSGKNQTTHTWGYLVLELDRQLPHMLLDAKGNNSIFGSNLPQMFRADQRLSLEGDFDSYFTLYCPREYERDALYVMTPDLMALLIDNAAPFDIEIVENQLFVYSAQPFVLTDPHVWQRLFQIIDVVGAKALGQTERYADERVGDPSIDYVAPAGQRLRSGISLPVAIGFIAIVGVMIWVFSLSILGS